jgi:hypothetical protein
MLPPSREIEKSIQETERSSSEERETRETEQSAAITSALAALKNHFEGEAKKEQTPKKIKIWTDTITLALVAATALFTGLAWWVFKGQLREMEKTYGPIKQSADATKAALIAGQRAWVRIDEMGVGGGGLSIGNDGAGVSISFVLTNIGNSPAIKLSYHPELVVMASGISIPNEQERVCEAARRQWQGGFTLFPNEQFPRTMGFGQYSVGTSALKDALERGLEVSADKQHVVLFVVGCVDYTFTTDPDTHHQTPFIRELTKRDLRAGGISIDEKIIPAEQLILREFGMGIGRAAD